MLLDRLQNDRSLSAFAGQFVPLKITTNNNPDWAQWSRKYPMTGNGIPQLYVVRADGEQIYGGAGSLRGDDLPTMLLASLKRSGRAFTSQEAEFLQRTVKASELALQSGDLLKTGVVFSEVGQLGPHDNLGSFAKPALKSKELYVELKKQIDARVAAAKSELLDSNSAKPLDSLLTVYEAEAVAKLFPRWKSEASSITREIKKQTQYTAQAEQAEAIVRARVVAASLSPRIRNRAESLYTSVIRRFPETEADTLARAELATVAPNAKILSMSPEEIKPSTSKAEGLRMWATQKGDFKTRAKYLRQKAGKVQLMKEDGETIVVDIAILSSNDQKYISQRSGKSE